MVPSLRTVKQKRESRLAIRNTLVGLPETFRNGEWHLSKKSTEDPLASVQFNPTSGRYESTDKSIQEDDCIAQAMVMLLLYRLEQDWSLNRTMNQLATWGAPNTSSTTPSRYGQCESELENL
jgi:hypothetical protein